MAVLPRARSFSPADILKKNGDVALARKKIVRRLVCREGKAVECLCIIAKTLFYSLIPAKKINVFL